MYNVLIIEITLFLCGSMYALFLGDKDCNMFLRILGGGLFFTFFYIFIPFTLILNNWNRS